MQKPISQNEDLDNYHEKLLYQTSDNSRSSELD